MCAREEREATDDVLSWYNLVFTNYHLPTLFSHIQAQCLICYTISQRKTVPVPGVITPAAIGITDVDWVRHKSHRCERKQHKVHTKYTKSMLNIFLCLLTNVFIQCYPCTWLLANNEKKTGPCPKVLEIQVNNKGNIREREGKGRQGLTMYFFQLLKLLSYLLKLLLKLLRNGIDLGYTKNSMGSIPLLRKDLK